MDIQTVKHHAEGYLVNGEIVVPYDPANRNFKEVQEWIDAGNTPEPIETPAEETARLLEEHRREQERRLRETDYTQLLDENALLDSVQQSEMATYRQEVRDATISSGFPYAPSWFISRRS